MSRRPDDCKRRALPALLDYYDGQLSWQAVVDHMRNMWCCCRLKFTECLDRCESVIKGTSQSRAIMQKTPVIPALQSIELYPCIWCSGV